MNDEQEEWRKQYSANIGAREILRLGCAVIIWLFIGIGVGIAFELAGFPSPAGSIIVGIFIIALFVFAFNSQQSKAGYPLVRRILGNNNLPTEPMPGPKIKILWQPLPWWAYRPGIWFLLLDLFILYIIVRRFFK